MLTVLSVAYPFAPVSRDAVGGAEQVLAQLDDALERAEHRSIVVAREDSRVAGTLVLVPNPGRVYTDAVARQVHRMVRAAIDYALVRWPVDVVHLHGLDFHAYLPRSGPPARWERLRGEVYERVGIGLRERQANAA